MKINCSVSPATFTALCDAVEGEPRWPTIEFGPEPTRNPVHIKRARAEGSKVVDVEIEILDDPQVGRATFDGLFDLLGFEREFPQRNLTRLSQLLSEAREIAGELRSSIPSSVKRSPSGSHLNNALFDVEAGLRTAIQAFEKMPS